MPFKHSPPARQTISQDRAQSVPTPTPRAPLGGTPAVPQLRDQLDRGPYMEGGAPSRKEGRGPRRSTSVSGVVGGFPGLSRTTLKGPGEDGKEEEKTFVEEEESDGTKGVPASVGASQGTGGPTLAQSDKPVSHQSEPSLLEIMQQMTRNPNYLLNSWTLFESQIFTLFGDPNEVRKSEAEVDSLRMKEGGHVSLEIANFRNLVLTIGHWGERAFIHRFKKGLPSMILDQLASHPSRIDSLQDLMDVTLELDTRYHERKKEKSNHQEKKPEASMSNSSHPQNSSGTSQKKKKNFQKRDNPILLC
ncbi:hypothetical protein O181_027452 [Austropuccinia psidii MF-1]|uniref:Uncharacterized protein n=1 Tax=Austropuccinia psidii MF-1 TaxID=1389203 RepID=A0A9Q3H1Q0_9BASI|nr:hypothetical protein [Austropuccinia psidii MF-1]